MIFLATCLFLMYCLAISRDREHFITSAVVSDEAGFARIQCWEFANPFIQYPTIGKAVHLANVSSLNYVVLPPRSSEGVHNAPKPMFFALLSGLAHVTLVNDTDDLWIMEGINNLIVAVDVLGTGHITDYPSDKETVALQIPFINGFIPPHKVLKTGPCDAPPRESPWIGSISNQVPSFEHIARTRRK